MQNTLKGQKVGSSGFLKFFLWIFYLAKIGRRWGHFDKYFSKGFEPSRQVGWICVDSGQRIWLSTILGNEHAAFTFIYFWNVWFTFFSKSLKSQWRTTVREWREERGWVSFYWVFSHIRWPKFMNQRMGQGFVGKFEWNPGIRNFLRMKEVYDFLILPWWSWLMTLSSPTSYTGYMLVMCLHGYALV